MSQIARNFRSPCHRWWMPPSVTNNWMNGWVGGLIGGSGIVVYDGCEDERQTLKFAYNTIRIKAFILTSHRYNINEHSKFKKHIRLLRLHMGYTNGHTTENNSWRNRIEKEYKIWKEE